MKRSLRMVSIIAILVVLAMISVRANSLSQNLSMHWTFDPNTSDKTGNGYNGIITGNTVNCTVNGQTGQGCLVSNQGHFLYANGVPILNSVPNGFGVASWVYFDTLGNKMLSSVGTNFIFQYNNGGGLDCNVVDSAGSYKFVLDPAFVPQVGRWYHLACTFNPADNTMRIYRDGVQTGVRNVGSFAQFVRNGITGLSCNNIYYCPSSPSSARVRYDDVRVYNRALNVSDASQLFNNIPAVCGNTIVETGEVCDSSSQSCTLNGYSGSQSCNAQCSGFNACTSSQFCGDNIVNGPETCDEGSLNGQPTHCNAQCTGITGSVCGNSIIEAGEVCDSNTQSCTINGYAGTRSCNAQCSAFNTTCTSSQFCGDNIINGNEICDEGSLNGQPTHCNTQCTGITPASSCGNSVVDAGEACDHGVNNGQAHYCNLQCNGITTPVYSNGGNANCPALFEGMNSNFVSGGYTNRQFVVDLPTNPQNASVIFAYHYLGGNAWEIRTALGLLGLEDQYNFILVSPVATGNAQYEWFTGTPPASNPDVALFDDVVACLHNQYNVDLDKVWVTGRSAGGAWSSYLAMHRSNDIAAVVTYSGGLQSPAQYVTPSSKIPTALVWGGPSDTFFQSGANFSYNTGDPQTFSFHASNLDLSSKYRQDGNFVVECEGTFGHTIPPNPANYTIPFLLDHPKWITPEPYATGLPAAMPSICRIPSGNSSVCGNGLVEAGEACDSNSQSCAVGGYSGSQSCNAQCSGYTICTSAQFCGDGTINGPEVCDGGGIICSANGWPGSCNTMCAGNISVTCGNGVDDAGEVCQ